MDTKFWAWNPGLILILIAGVLIIIAGIYFKINDLSSTGVSLGLYGAPNRTGTINGNGMFFCGLLISGIAIGMAYNKKTEE